MRKDGITSTSSRVVTALKYWLNVTLLITKQLGEILMIHIFTNHALDHNLVNSIFKHVLDGHFRNFGPFLLYLSTIWFLLCEE